MFGMHPNADISFAQAETYACLNTLLALQPRQVGTAAASVEEVTNRLAQDMLSTIPRTFDLTVMQQKYFIEIFTRILFYMHRWIERLCFYVYTAKDRTNRGHFFLTAHFLRSRLLFSLTSLKTRITEIPYISNVHV